MPVKRFIDDWQRCCHEAVWPLSRGVRPVHSVCIACKISSNLLTLISDIFWFLLKSHLCKSFIWHTQQRRGWEAWYPGLRMLMREEGGKVALKPSRNQQLASKKWAWTPLLYYCWSAVVDWFIWGVVAPFLVHVHLRLSLIGGWHFFWGYPHL